MSISEHITSTFRSLKHRNFRLYFTGQLISLAALSIARFGSGEVLYRGVGWTSLLFSLALLIFSRSQYLPLSLIALLFCGFFMTTILSGNNSLVQLPVADHLRGRVMSLYTTVAIGLMPIGNLAVGYMAHLWQAPTTIAICACLTGLSGIVYLALAKKDEHFVQAAETNVEACYHNCTK